MIFQAVIGALVARKAWKVYKKSKELRDLKALGESLGLPYVPGEDIETYRRMLCDVRDNCHER